MIDVDENYLYFLRVDFNCWIVTAESLKYAIEENQETGVLHIHDIAGNYSCVPIKKDTRISYQKLYNIEEVLRCEDDE